MKEDKPAKIRVYWPEQLGWVRIRDRVWKTPEGQIYEFPRGVLQIIHLLEES